MWASEVKRKDDRLTLSSSFQLGKLEENGAIALVRCSGYRAPRDCCWRVPKALGKFPSGIYPKSLGLG